MKSVKRDWRSSLGEKTLEFDAQPYVTKFFETLRRPTAHKTQPHKKMSTMNDNEETVSGVSEYDVCDEVDSTDSGITIEANE